MEGLLDTIEGDDLRDEGVEIETALLVEIDQHRKVTTRKAVAVPTRLERTASTEDVEERKRQLHVGPRNTDEHDGAGEVAGLEALRIDLRQPDRLDRDIDTVATGEFADLLDRILGGGVDRVRRTETGGPLELLVVDVDGDDDRRTCELRTGNGCVADAATTEDGDAVAAADAAGVDPAVS